MAPGPEKNKKAASRDIKIEMHCLQQGLEEHYSISRPGREQKTHKYTTRVCFNFIFYISFLTTEKKMEREKSATRNGTLRVFKVSLSRARASVRARVLKRHFKSREEI